MKILNTLGIFLFTFFVGNLSVFQTNSDLLQKNKLLVEPEKRQICLLNPSKKEPEFKTFKVEGFWDQNNEPSNERLLETGEASNIEDIKAKSGEIWLGLFNKKGKDFLTSTKIKVKSYREHNLDWKEVSVKNKTNPLFLIKKSKNLKEGKVKTLFRIISSEESENYDETNSIQNGFFKTFSLGKKEYILRAEMGLSEKKEKILVLLLETGGESQIIHYIYYMEEGDYVGNLYWVGDLDGDGKLDLFMDFYNYEKGGYSSGLFLSSEAEKGKLVKEIGYFALSAC